jgi:hypothetical protein
MTVCVVFAALFILTAFIALWYAVYDEVTQQTGMKPPRFGTEARRSRRRFWIVVTAIIITLLIALVMIG